MSDFDTWAEFGHTAGSRRFLWRVIGVALDRFRWFRRLHGGHWEYWWVDVPVTAEAWHQVEQCSLRSGERPSSLCRGTPKCEDWQERTWR